MNTQSNFSNNKRYKVIFVTCTYKRPEITERIISIWENLQEKTSQFLEFENIIVDSEKTNFDIFVNKKNFKYYDYKNHPISDKWNFAVSQLIGKNFDYVIFLGSDDFIDESLIRIYYEKMNNGYDYIGIHDMYVFNTINQNLYYWGGYKQGSGRQGETIGLGRCLSKNIIEKLNYNPWGLGLNRGLDGSMQIKLKNIDNITTSFINLKRDGGFACDVKSDFNITKIKDYKTDFELIDHNSIIYRNNFKNFLNIKKHKVSIIIPTYKNTQYIDECLNSIIESGKNYNIEVLVGIDACEETLTYIKTKTYPDFIKFYYFSENNGPYLILNSLSQIASSNKLLFFGSDDIMTKITIGEVVNNLDTYDLVRLRYQNYVEHNPIGNTSNFGEGAFSINKNIFLSLNGFEPWRVAADSDFMGRIYKMRLKIYHTREIAFYYRQHPTSLTKRPDTGMGSSLRANYAKISKNKRNNVNPSKLHTTDFDSVDVNTYTIEINQTLQKQLEEQRRVRDEKLNSVFNKTIRKTVEVTNKKGDPVIIDRLDFLYRNNSEPTRIIKPNIPQDRQELINQKNNTNKNTIKKMFDIKPNHREGKNFITLGGKINK